MKKILIYGADEALSDSMQTIAQAHDIPMYVIDDNSLDLKVKDILKIEDDMSEEHRVFADSYLLMSGLTMQEMLDLFNDLQKHGIDYDGVRILQNPTNNEMTVAALFKAAREENETAALNAELQDLIMECRTVDFAKMKDEELHAFHEDAQEAYHILQDGVNDADRIRKAVESLRTDLEDAPRMYN